MEARFLREGTVKIWRRRGLLVFFLRRIFEVAALIVLCFSLARLTHRSKEPPIRCCPGLRVRRREGNRPPPEEAVKLQSSATTTPTALAVVPLHDLRLLRAPMPRLEVPYYMGAWRWVVVRTQLS